MRLYDEALRDANCPQRASFALLVFAKLNAKVVLLKFTVFRYSLTLFAHTFDFSCENTRLPYARRVTGTVTSNNASNCKVSLLHCFNVQAAQSGWLRTEGAGRHDSTRVLASGRWRRGGSRSTRQTVGAGVLGARCRPSRRTGSCRHPHPRAACTRHPCSPSQRAAPASQAERAVWPASAAEAAARPRLAGAWSGLSQAPLPAGALSG